MKANDWKTKELWTQRGNGFCVEIVHYQEEYEGRMEHRWNVETYIYPNHPHFPNFKGDSMFQDASGAMPLHAGPSLLRYHYGNDKGTITSVQVGADYNHLYDDRFKDIGDRELAGEVFRDAQALVMWLQDFRPDLYLKEHKP